MATQSLRMKIEIISVTPRQPVPNKTYQVMEFKAKYNNQEYLYKTYKTAVMDKIVAGKTLEVDVEIKPTQVGEAGEVDRVVVGIVDPNRIKEYGVDASIEAQTAVNNISRLRCDKVDHDEELDQMADDWCKKALGRVL